MPAPKNPTPTSVNLADLPPTNADSDIAPSDTTAPPTTLDEVVDRLIALERSVAHALDALFGANTRPGSLVPDSEKE